MMKKLLLPIIIYVTTLIGAVGIYAQDAAAPAADTSGQPALNIFNLAYNNILLVLAVLVLIGDEPDADGRRWGTLEAQVETTANLTLQPGVTGLVVDAEIEFENKRAEATKLCTLLRARLGTRKLAYTTFGWMAPHPNFPFEELDAHCGERSCRRSTGRSAGPAATATAWLVSRATSRSGSSRRPSGRCRATSVILPSRI